MQAGKNVQLDSPERIYQQPVSRFVAEFVGRNNIFAGTVAGGVINVDGTQLPLPGAADGPAEIVVAADRMTVSLERPNTAALAAEFVSEEFVGTAIICYFEGPGGEELKAQVTARELELLAPEPGKHFFLSWEPAAPHVMAVTS